MSTGADLARAWRAIFEANAVLRKHGQKAVRIELDAINFTRNLAHAEVTTCLKEPARQLVTLLHNRSHQLAADQAELDATVEELTRYDHNPRWGAF